MGTGGGNTRYKDHPIERFTAGAGGIGVGAGRNRLIAALMIRLRGEGGGNFPGRRIWDVDPIKKTAGGERLQSRGKFQHSAPEKDTNESKGLDLIQDGGNIKRCR